jgi:CRP/FNR family transcriptional regulator, cyclic AMP receptor protein
MGLRSPPRTDLVEVFGARGWLSSQPKAFRSLVISKGVQVFATVGSVVFRRDDPANGLYGIISGAIGVDCGTHRQSPLLGHVMRQGEWFGTKALYGGNRELAFQAIEVTQLLFVPRSEIIPLMQASADVAVRVGQLGEHGDRMSWSVIRDLLTPDAGRRLAAVLYRVLGAGEVAPDDPEGFRLNHQQLGEMANLSRHHVGRKLAVFEAAGWIACGYNRVQLLDPGSLAAFACGDDEG